MEDWQITHIIKNLPKLIASTNFNAAVKAELLAENIICQADVDEADAVHKQCGKSEASSHYYELLLGRERAYKVLTKALMKCRQTGASGILIRVPPELYSKPLTYLDISTELTSFQDACIQVNGKMLKLHEFFPAVYLEKLKELFQDCLGEIEIYDTFIAKQTALLLASNTIPTKPPFYVPRFLSNRIKVDEHTFKADCTDVFVFKNTIPRYKLSEIAKPHFTDTSTSQLTKITCRFIYLDEEEDWTELKKIAKVPIHLINYDANRNHFCLDWVDPTVLEDLFHYWYNVEQVFDAGFYELFNNKTGLGYQYILEDTSAPVDILNKLGSCYERVYLTEEDFVQQQLFRNSTSSSVCICDTPGMGKTFLLANIARLMTENSTGRIIVFTTLATFANDFYTSLPNTLSNWKALLASVLTIVSPSGENSELLLKLVDAKLISLEIFFDGFDEISADRVVWTKHAFRSITTNFSNVRIYITSRPHMRSELEESLGVVAYDILPFNHQSQIDFLVQFWQNCNPSCEKVFLQDYATSCLRTVKKSLSTYDKQMAGIPLLCQLIAEVYADKVAFQRIKRKFLFEVPLKISEMYKTLVEKKINQVANDKKEFEDIKLFYTWHALKLIFPTKGFHEDNHFNSVNGLLDSAKILKVGILQRHLSGSPEFIHRTFAEYLVAEYFFTKLQDNAKEMNCNSMPILKVLLECQSKYEWSYRIMNPVIAYFFNDALGEVNFSEELKSQEAAYIFSISNQEFISLLRACCQHNLFNIFSSLGEAMAKCEKSQIAEYFTDKNCYELLYVCIKKSTSKWFHFCIQLFTELKLDLAKINTFDKNYTLLQKAVEWVNYEAVEYFVNNDSIRSQRILEICVGYGYDIEKRENILNLLLNKMPLLIHEAPDILVNRYNEVDVRLLKILVKFGVNLTHALKNRYNCAMNAARYMSPCDYHELVQFLLTDCKAAYLFLPNKKWKDPLHYIIKKATLLPETLELLLNIPGIDVNIKDKHGENLLFSAAEGTKLNTLKELLKLGLDYHARGKNNRTLFHAAAENGGVEMFRFLLSLKLDPNARDEYERTPLHYALTIFQYLPVVQILVENGASVQAKDYKGQTALHVCAAEYNNSSNQNELFKYLIRRGAGVNDRDNGENTPLHLCATKQVGDCLIEMGADIHAKNKMGKTAEQMDPRFCVTPCSSSDCDTEDGKYFN